MAIALRPKRFVIFSGHVIINNGASDLTDLRESGPNEGEKLLHVMPVTFSNFFLPFSNFFILGLSYEVGGYYCRDSFIRKLCCSFKVGINLKFSTAIITLGIHYNRGFTSSKILKRTYQNSYLTDHEKNNNNYKKLQCDIFLLFYSLQPCSRV